MAKCEKQYFGEEPSPTLTTFIKSSSDEMFFGRTLKWSITNYSTIGKGVDEALDSPRFSVGKDDETVWVSKFTPGGRGDNLANYISLHLVSCTPLKAMVVAKIRFRCCDANGLDLVNSFESEYMKFTLDNELTISLDNRTYHTFDEGVNRRPNPLLNDQVDVYWDMVVLKNDMLDEISNLLVAHDALPKNLEQLYQSKKLADVVLVVDGKEIVAHKAILAARSPVLDGMVSRKIAESKKLPIPALSRLTLNDVSLDGLTELLYYMYTGKTPRMEEIVQDLFVVADRFGQEDLKQKCEECLCSDEFFSIPTVSSFMIKAFQHNAGNKMKSHIIKFIKQNLKEIEKTDGWKDLLKRFPALASEVVKFSFELQSQPTWH